MSLDPTNVVIGAALAREAVAEAVTLLASADPQDWSDGGVDNYLAARAAALGVGTAVGGEIDHVVAVAARFASEVENWDLVTRAVGFG